MPSYVKFETDQGTLVVRLDEILAVAETNRPDICVLLTKHGPTDIRGTIDFFLNCFEAWFGGVYEATPDMEDTDG